MITDDYELESSLTSLTLNSQPSTLNSPFTRPQRVFKGCALHPYTHGMDLLMAQVTDLESDTRLYHWLAFLFLHLVRDPQLSPADDRKRNLLPLAWEVRSFRAALIDWLDQIQLSDLDKLEAKRLYEEMRAEADGARVEVAPSRGGGKKKPAASPRAKRRS